MTTAAALVSSSCFELPMIVVWSRLIVAHPDGLDVDFRIAPQRSVAAVPELADRGYAESRGAGKAVDARLAACSWSTQGIIAASR